MGSLILEEALKDFNHFRLSGIVEHPTHPQIGKPHPVCSTLTVASDLNPILPHADLLIEFTTPQATVEHAELAARYRVGMLTGTTGLSDEDKRRLQQAAQSIPILWAPNFSMGIALLRRTMAHLFHLIDRFGLKDKTAFRLSETHHIHKQDKPSGTAKVLAQDLRTLTGREIADQDIEAIRMGEVVGLHTVTFCLPAEDIRLTHEALDRRVFAQGALWAARHFHRIAAKPGWYTLEDFIGQTIGPG